MIFHIQLTIWWWTHGIACVGGAVLPDIDEDLIRKQDIQLDYGYKRKGGEQ